MPSKQQNVQQAPALGAIHHAHTISRATNFHYLQDKSARPAYNNQYYQQQPTLNSPPNHVDGALAAAVAKPYYYLPAANELSTIGGGGGSPLHDSRGTIMMHKQLHESLMSTIERQAMLNRPLCRCRVMYLGSSVPHMTKNGLHGIQEPLRHLYPEEQFNKAAAGGSSSSSSSGYKLSPPATSTPAAGSQAGADLAQRQKHPPNTIDISHLSSSLGIDSWLSVWSNGLLLENYDESGRELKRFFSIESLHYCAAVRYFDTKTLAGRSAAAAAAAAAISGDNFGTEAFEGAQGNHAGDQNNNSIGAHTAPNGYSAAHTAAAKQRPCGGGGGGGGKGDARFLPLDAPLFQCPGMLDANHPPVFAAIMRRTTGIKVLECHAFICRRDAASNALVKCCTQAYADLLAAKRLSHELASAGSYRPPRSMMYAAAAAAAADYADARSQPRGQASQRSQGRRTSASNYSSKHSSLRSPAYESVTLEANISRRQLPSVAAKIAAADLSDNSLDASSEDNYAIISRHHYNQQQKQAGRTDSMSQHRGSKPTKQQTSQADKQQPASGAAGSGGGSSGQQKRAGSSKSLFTDFMPKSAGVRDSHSDLTTGNHRSSGQSKRQSAGSELADKLSQSADLMELGLAPTCCPETGSGDRGSVKYSLVGSKHHSGAGNKRHSRSMHNLDGPYEFSAALADGQHRRSHRAARKHRRSGRSSRGDSNRRSASYHDISEGEPLQYRTSTNSKTLVAPTDSDLIAVHPVQSNSSSHQSLASSLHPATTGSLIQSGNGKLPEHLRDDVDDNEDRYGEILGDGNATMRRRSRQPLADDFDERKLAPRTNDGMLTQTDDRHLNGGRQASKLGAQSRRRADRSSAHYHHQHSSSRLPCNDLLPAAPAANEHHRQHHQFNHHHHYPYQQSPYAIGGLPHAFPPYYPPPLPQAAPNPNGVYMHPYYLSPAVAYHHPAAATKFLHYPAHTLAPHYGAPYGRQPGFPLCNPAAEALQARQQQQQQLVPAACPAPSGGTGSRNANNYATQKPNKANSGKTVVSRTLASGFRCLSPPVNFLASFKQHRQSTASEMSLNGAPDESIALAPDQPADAEGPQDDATGAGEHIVSAQPGFLLSSATGSARAKKMSWIKRLSLTMSASPDPEGLCQSPAAVEGVTTNGGGGGGARRKKRSSLFSGSLTIGRRGRQPQQQDCSSSKLVDA